jgi:hypothetical protein
VNFKVNKDKVRSRREYEASWKRLARYSLHRREELRGRGDIFQQRTAAFAGCGAFPAIICPGGSGYTEMVRGELSLGRWHGTWAGRATAPTASVGCRAG